MNRGAVFSLVFLGILSQADGVSAGSFGIDFSPLQAPGFGKRPDTNSGQTSPNGGSGTEAAREPKKMSPEMAQLQKTLAAEGAHLSGDVIRIPDSWPLPDGSMTTEIITRDVGNSFFNIGTKVPTTFSIPTDHSPPVKVASESLPIAASILSVAVSRDRDLSDEDRAFLAGQAAMALEGAPLRVEIEGVDTPAVNVTASRAEEALADVADALRRVGKAQKDRRAAEAKMRANKVEYLIRTRVSENRLQELQQIRDDYNKAILSEAGAKNDLSIAQKALVDAFIPPK